MKILNRVNEHTAGLCRLVQLDPRTNRLDLTESPFEAGTRIFETEITTRLNVITSGEMDNTVLLKTSKRNDIGVTISAD